MAIYKRGGVYWFHFIFDGRHIQKSTKTKDMVAARQIEAAYRVKLAKGEVGIEERQPAPDFKTAMTDFLAWSKFEHSAKSNTHRRYTTSSKALLRYFKDTPLDRITSDSVEGFKRWRMKQKGERTNKKLCPATVNRELACLKILFNRFKRIVPLNPVSDVRFLKEDNEQMRVLSPEEEKTYLLAASQPLRDIATLMVETGMRPEEVCRIRRENVHLRHGYLFNPYGKTKAARRKVPLSERAARVLAKRLEKPKGIYLFRGRGVGDAPVLHVNRAHTSAVTRSKVRQFRLYDLRHTWATRAAMAGVDIVTLAAMLGHSKLAMVTRYCHPTEQHQFEAMLKVQSFVAGELKKEQERVATVPATRAKLLRRNVARK
jgi:integrase